MLSSLPRQAEPMEVRHGAPVQAARNPTGATTERQDGRLALRHGLQIARCSVLQSRRHMSGCTAAP